MKNLIIILLVSILGFGFVILQKQDRNIDFLTTLLNTNCRVTHHILSKIHTDMQFYSDVYPLVGQFYQKVIKSEKFLQENHSSFRVPKISSKAKILSKEWNKNIESYWKNVDVDSIDKEMFIRLSATITDDFYHQNNSFRELLLIIQKSRLANQQIVATNFLNERVIGSNISWDYSIDIPKTKVIQIDKSSTLPFSISTFHKRKFSIQKLWINNQLVFEKTLENPRISRKFNLTYRGKNQQHVKAAFHNSYSLKPIYKERIFDFQIHTCE